MYTREYFNGSLSLVRQGYIARTLDYLDFCCMSRAFSLQAEPDTVHVCRVHDIVHSERGGLESMFFSSDVTSQGYLVFEYDIPHTNNRRLYPRFVHHVNGMDMAEQYWVHFAKLYRAQGGLSARKPSQYTLNEGGFLAGATKFDLESALEERWG